jgi:hypothetical protein
VAGNITAAAYRMTEKNHAWTVFDVTTYRVVKDGDNKIRIPEVHEVRMFNSGSIFEHLRVGKFVVVQGRVVPDTEHCNSYVQANGVTFPTKGDSF